jgi:hypothetical protein
MSKNSLYLIVAIAMAATAATFFVAKTKATVQCQSIIAGPQDLVVGQHMGGTASANITARGYPFGYYQEPLPSGCVVTDNSVVGSTFNPARMAYDFLIWAAVAFLLFLPSALLKWWRGPRMLGDFGRRA